MLYVLCQEIRDSVSRRRFGDVAERFDRTLGLLPAQRTAVEVFRGAVLPPPSAFAGIVVSGSPAMVDDPEPWIGRLVDWLRAAASQPVPLLGICFGHQVLAHALGGRVGYGAAGWEYGMVEVQTTPAACADALFGPLPRRLRVTESHRMSVLEPPPGAVVLATSPRDACHAFRWGAQGWGVQFHPERGAGAIRRMLQHDGPRLQAGNGRLPPLEVLLAALRPSLDGRRLMRRFAALCGFGRV